MILYGSRVAGLANGGEGQANEEKTNRQGHSKTIHGESPLLIRLSLVRLRCIVRLRLVGVLLLTSKDTKNLLQRIGFLFVFLVLGLDRLGGLSLAGSIGWPIRIVGNRFSVGVLGRLLGLTAAEHMGEPGTTGGEHVVAAMNLAVLRGRGTGNVDLLARGGAIRSGQLQGFRVDEHGLNAFRSVEILHVAIG